MNNNKNRQQTRRNGFHLLSTSINRSNKQTSVFYDAAPAAAASSWACIANRVESASTTSRPGIGARRVTGGRTEGRLCPYVRRQHK